jgi:hypothetical protein
VASVRERTIPAERPPHVGEVSANFCGCRVPLGQCDGSLRPYSRLSRPVYGSKTQLNQLINVETSVRNKCQCSFYCALLTLHVSAPIGGHLQVGHLLRTEVSTFIS